MGKLCAAIVSVVGILSAASAQAVTLTNPLSPCSDFSCTLTTIVNGVWSIASAAAGVMILIGGFQLLFAGGNEERVSAGKKTILWAVIGLAVVFLAGGVAKLLSSIVGTS